MEDYPPSYVARPRPLLFLSGFETDTERVVDAERPFRHGTRINSTSPVVSGPEVGRILQEFQSFDPGDLPTTVNIRPMHFRIKAVQRNYELPCRKSSPAPRSPGVSDPAPSLHSSLSPLSPSSPLHPDGVMSPLWPLKWQELVPAVWISVFSLPADGDIVTDDEVLKNEIIALRNALAEPYHIRFAVIILGDAGSAATNSVDERLSNLRKATKLDTKTSFFYARPDLSKDDLSSFVTTILTALRPIAQDFYRDLTKYTRKRKDRQGYSSTTISPPTSPVAQALPRSGWAARYEYKLGLFAEFRFEMDAASRHFYAALDALFDSDGLFENLSNWSPRWNEVRLFADIIAIRQIRCLLANGLPLPAVRFWVKYRDTTKFVLERRGKGTANYGWMAWQARWAKVMARLVQASTGIAIDLVARKTLEGISPGKGHVYLELANDAASEESYEPWESLHHAGYWFTYSAELTTQRRAIARRVPEVDRIPPGQSPATQVARRNEIYDTYLCPPPHLEYPVADSDAGFEYTHEIVKTLQDALSEFQQRSQNHMVDTIKLRIAKELENNSDMAESLTMIRPLWQSHAWRGARWLALGKEVTAITYRTARGEGDTTAQVSSLWELMAFDTLDNVPYDFKKVLGSISPAPQESQEFQRVQLKHAEIESALDINFTFIGDEAHASEALRAQIVVHSRFNAAVQPLVIEELHIALAGSVGTILLSNKTDDSDSSNTTSAYKSHELKLTEDTTNDGDRSRPSYAGYADLTVRAGQTLVYNVSIVPREAGAIKAVQAEAIIQKAPFEFHYLKNFPHDTLTAEWWYGGQNHPRRRTTIRNPSQVLVHPKLPKVRISFADFKDLYYVGEVIVAEVEICNEEAATVSVALDLRIPGHDELIVSINQPSTLGASEETLSLSLAGTLELGFLEHSALRQITVHIRAPTKAGTIVLQAKAMYTMESPLSITSSADIAVLKPFETQYSINPELHPDMWPNFFELANSPEGEGGEEQNSDQQLPVSITNCWGFQTSLRSIAKEKVKIQSLELELKSISEGANCNIRTKPDLAKPAILVPKAIYDGTFSLDTTRVDLEDLRTTLVEAILKVHWTRASSDTMITTSLPTPRLTFPSSEPRVLASLTPASTSEESNILHIDLTLENPSMHFLTFNVSLEPDESFVFSGPKSVTKHLLPISRDTVRYSVLPLERDRFIRPLFKVVDVHFNKSLSVNPTGVLRADQGDLMVWTGPGEIPPAATR